MLHTTPLALACYDLMRQIPRGKVTTYKILADKLGTGPRVIGRICGANPDIPVTPCHRVIRSDGKVDGYAHGTAAKIQILTAEGVPIDDRGRIAHLDQCIYRF